MLLLSEPPCGMRESADGDRWQRCPCPPRGSAAGGRWYGAYPLSTRQVEALMEDRGGGGALPAPPVGHPVQPAAGGGMPPAPAPGVGPWAEGCNRHEGPRPVALSGAGGGQTRPDHGLAAYRASRHRGRAAVAEAGRAAATGSPRRCPWTVAPPRPPRSRGDSEAHAPISLRPGKTATPLWSRSIAPCSV